MYPQSAPVDKELTSCCNVVDTTHIYVEMKRFFSHSFSQQPRRIAHHATSPAAVALPGTAPSFERDGEPLGQDGGQR